MLKKKYKVKGQNVNDYMVMQDFAYHIYPNDILHSFLFQKGFTKKRIAMMEVNLEPLWQKLNHYQELLFTQEFYLYLEITGLDHKGILRVNYRFFNMQNELCATLISAYYINNTFRKSISGCLPVSKIEREYNHLAPNML